MSSRIRRLSAGLFVAVATVASAPPARAATVSYASAPLDSYNVKGTAYATVIIGETVYVGGNFSKVRHNGVDYAYPHLAAFDLATGALVTGFTPNPNNEVRSLATDGTNLYAGGKFISIGGQWRTRVAKLDPNTGAADVAFNASASARVDALAIDGTRVFLGGQFSTVSGAARQKLAAVDSGSGVIDAWDPGAGNGNVTAVALSPDASVLYVGGGFTTIAGSSRTKLAAVSTASATVVGNDFSGANENVKSLDVDDAGTTLYAGDEGNDLESYAVASGTRNWRNTVSNGDIQATHVAADGNVYMGFHDGADGLTNARIAAVDAVTGSTETWNPTFSSTYGVFAITSTPSELVVGGEFWQISGVAQDGVAIFPIA